MNQQKYFSLAEIWNAGFEEEPRKYEPRDRMWATELGKMDIDIILKMNGVEPTNEASDRAKRKFEAGNMWEWLISLVLKRSGIYISSQDRVEYQEGDNIKVSGKIDFVVGGKPDLVKAREAMAVLEELEFPKEFIWRGKKVIDYIEKEFPEGIAEQLLELKTCSRLVFDMIERTEKPSFSYSMQLFHYVRNKKLPGVLTYLCKDDNCMKDFLITPENEILENFYQEKIKRVSEIYRSGILPPKENVILWNEELKKFTLNLNVQWSNYLTLNYDLKDETEYGDIYRGVVSSWNSVVESIKSKKPMTAKNLSYIEKMEANGFEITKLLNEQPIILTGEELKAYKDKLKADKKLQEIEDEENLSPEEIQVKILFLQKKKDILVNYVPEVIPKEPKIKKTKN
jgi:hypothetical protein